MNQQQTKLQQLCQYLATSLTPTVKANDIDAWQERGQLIISGEDLGLGSYLIGKWKYTAVIAIERLPHRRIDPYNLLAMVAAWLIEHNPERDTYGLADPDFDIAVISKDNFTVLIEIELLDDIELVQDELGPILFMGNRYRVAVAETNIAESVDVRSKGAV